MLSWQRIITFNFPGRKKIFCAYSVNIQTIITNFYYFDDYTLGFVIKPYSPIVNTKVIKCKRSQMAYKDLFLYLSKADFWEV